jgi:hypothetical protein
MMMRTGDECERGMELGDQWGWGEEILRGEENKYATHTYEDSIRKPTKHCLESGDEEGGMKIQWRE